MTTTADETALLHAIRTHPAEDTPRLAYADWLDENAGEGPCPKCLGTGSHALDPYALAARYGTHRAGQMLDAARCGHCSGTGRASDGRRERAELVRVQIEIERLHRSTPLLDYATALAIVHGPIWDLRQRERAIWREWSRRWFGWGIGTENFGSALTPNEVDLRVRRGFVFEVRMPLAAFLDAAKGLFATHPIERVVLTDREPEAFGSGGTAPTFWRWFMAGEVPQFVSDDPSVLPDAIWRLFHDYPPYNHSTIRQTLGWEFASRDEAMAALSAACVAYGRGLAGLPT